MMTKRSDSGGGAALSHRLDESEAATAAPIEDVHRLGARVGEREERLAAEPELFEGLFHRHGLDRDLQDLQDGSGHAVGAHRDEALAGPRLVGPDPVLERAHLAGQRGEGRVYRGGEIHGGLLAAEGVMLGAEGDGGGASVSLAREHDPRLDRLGGEGRELGEPLLQVCPVRRRDGQAARADEHLHGREPGSALLGSQSCAGARAGSRAPRDTWPPSGARW